MWFDILTKYNIQYITKFITNMTKAITDIIPLIRNLAIWLVKIAVVILAMPSYPPTSQ